MRAKLRPDIAACRRIDPPFDSYHHEGKAATGAFQVAHLRIIASPGIGETKGWEHVSVSCEGRTPSWGEMCQVKEWFFEDHETVVQFHPAKTDYINCHPFTLHLWRSTRRRDRFPMPPKVLV